MTPWLVFTMSVLLVTDNISSYTLLATQYVSSKPASPEPRNETSNVALLDCGNKWSCRDYDGNNIFKRSYFVVKGCACDDLCPFFSDCCPDYGRVFLDASPGFTNGVDDDKPGVDVNASSSPPHQAFNEDSVWSRDKNPTTEQPSTDRTELLRQYGLTKDMFTCIYDTALSSVDRVSVVGRCPETWRDRALADLCLTSSSDDHLTRLPVSGDITLVVYRNMFCAICHKEPFRYWRPSINCSSRESLPFNLSTSLTDVFTNGTNCTTLFMPPALHFHLRPCFEAEIINNCSQTYSFNSPENRKIASRCMDNGSDYSMAYSYTQAYRNQFCAFCNNVSIQDLSCALLVVASGPEVMTMSGNSENNAEAKDLRSRLPYSFSILLDINIHKRSTTVGIDYNQQTDERNESFTCQTGQVFDPFRSVCRDVACGENMYFRDNQCVQVEGSISDYDANSSSYVTRVPSHLSALIDCLPILLNDTEFQLDENGSLQLVDTGLIYDKTQYYITESGTFLCVNYTQNYTRTVNRQVRVASFTFSVTEGLVSACCLGVSLLALAVTFIIYACLRPLRNIPGRNLLSLLAALFLAEALLLVATSAESHQVACQVVAGAMHYFFLASFFWMNVMAVDVWFTFSQAFVRAGDRGKSSKRFRTYSAYSWLAPLLFVLPAVLIQILDDDSPVNPRYGEEICWVANVYALLIFFAAPVLLLLIFNVVFFSISVRNIAHTRATAARMLGKEDKQKMGIYVRLTVVMGLTWTLGFVEAIIPHEILRYSFVLMNTLQGLFTCISFVCTKKVIQLLKDKVRGKSIKISKSRSTDLTTVSKSASLGIQGLSFSSTQPT